MGDLDLLTRVAITVAGLVLIALGVSLLDAWLDGSPPPSLWLDDDE